MSTPEAQTALVTQYCTTCHNQQLKSGGLSLVGFNAAEAAQQAQVAEKMVRKLRAGMMPPAGIKRPDEATLQSLAESLETRIDRVAAAKPRAAGGHFNA